MGWNELPTEFMGWSPGFQNVTLFGSRALADVIKLRWDHTDVVWAPIQYDLCPYKRVNQLLPLCKETYLWKVEIKIKLSLQTIL